LVYAYLDSDPGAPKPDPNKPRKRVVILGSGWGAVSALKEIDKRYYDVTVISPRNYFLFTPLLPSVTVGTVDARSITDPVRLMSSDGFTYVEAKCTNVDPQNNTVTCTGKQDVFYEC
jgi:NADH dehydrogenase FAD-containing subunit